MSRGGNLGSLGLIQVFRLASGMAVNVMVMRGLGVEGFGVYGYVTTLVGLASFGATLGMDRLLKRDIALEEDTQTRRHGHHVGTGLAAVLLLSAITAVGVVGWVWAVDGRADVVRAASVATIALTLQSLAMVPNAWFHAVRRMKLGVPAAVAGRLALVSFTALFLWARLGVVAVFLASMLDATASLLVASRVYLRQAGLPPTPRWSDVRALIVSAVPFGLNSLFGSIYLSADVLLLAWMCGDAEVGIYRGALVLIALFPVLAETFTAAVYPRMVRHTGSPEAVAEELRFVTRLLLAVSLPAAVGGVVLAERLLVFVGGAAYAPSALPFMILAPVLPLRFLNNGFGMTLTALGRQVERTRGAFLAAIVNISANIVVLPSFGAPGAAATTLATEGLLALWMCWRLGPLTGHLRLGSSLLRTAAPAACMAAVIATLPDVPVLVAVALGAAVDIAAGRATGAWARADLTRLRRI